MSRVAPQAPEKPKALVEVAFGKGFHRIPNGIRTRAAALKVRPGARLGLWVSTMHIGCRLDTRFLRVDNGRVEWYDLDLPELIDLRRRLLGEDQGRHHLLPGSVLGEAWIETVTVHALRPGQLRYIALCIDSRTGTHGSLSRKE